MRLEIHQPPFYNYNVGMIISSIMNSSDLGRALNALRKTHGGGGGKPRTVQHDPSARYCLCVDCRKARGQYPAHLLDKPKTAKPAKPAKPAKSAKLAKPAKRPPRT